MADVLTICERVAASTLTATSKGKSNNSIDGTELSAEYQRNACLRLRSFGRRPLGRRLGFLVPSGHRLQTQYLLSGARPERDAIGARGRLQ